MRDIYCECGHVTDDEPCEYQGKAFCCEECIDKYVHRKATADDYYAFTMNGNGYDDFTVFLRENPEVLRDCDRSMLPFTDVWDTICEEYCKYNGYEDFRIWFEEEGGKHRRAEMKEAG